MPRHENMKAQRNTRGLSLSPRITRRQGHLHYSFNELAFRAGICLARRRDPGAEPARELTLKRLVFPRDIAVLAKVVAKRQRASFLSAASLNDMNMMGVRPRPRTMKERTKCIVGVRHVHVSELTQPARKRADWVDLFERDLNVDNRLRRQPWNGRGAVVIDAASQAAERSGNPIPFRLELENPPRIVRNDLQLFYKSFSISPEQSKYSTFGVTA